MAGHNLAEAAAASCAVITGQDTFYLRIKESRNPFLELALMIALFFSCDRALHWALLANGFRLSPDFYPLYSAGVWKGGVTETLAGAL